MANPSPLASGSSIIRLDDTVSAQPATTATGPSSVINTTGIGATPASSTQTSLNDKWCKNATSVEQLRNLELIPLLLDVMEGVNSGKILPKDVENAVS